MTKTLAINGRVQGVFFRASTKDKAQELGIKGFVRNEPDGSVYVEAEGNSEALETFVAWCHHGPPMARVDSIAIQDVNPRNFHDFHIER